MIVGGVHHKDGGGGSDAISEAAKTGTIWGMNADVDIQRAIFCLCKHCKAVERITGRRGPIMRRVTYHFHWRSQVVVEVPR